mmetsp:Transcript_105852/g.298205  ORF Transcript_105852/g.298205 Transcript_105852/m.298205 type:complete len:488 (-) Transcript_105852:23-1486(-)
MDLDPVSRVLFPRPPPSYTVDSFPGELIWVPRSLNPQTSSPEDCIPLCLLQCKGAQKLVVYIHSNFEDLGRCHNFCLSLRYHLKAHVLAVEYPSYGISPGSSCDEQRATESAHVAVRFAHEVLRWPWDSIILLGRSIGTGPATALAAMHRFGGLVLVAPFLSVKELCREYIGAAAGLIRERFPNGDLISQVKSPCLFIHGKKDTMVPVRHGIQMHSSCTARKRFVSPVDMEHNTDLLDHEDYLVGPMREFFDLPGVQGSEMQVPSWAFDKQLSPDFVPVAPVAGQQRASCSLLGTSCACPGACRPCGCNGGPMNVKMVHVEPVRTSCQNSIQVAHIWVVEETITGAVEYSGLDQPEPLEPDPEGLFRSVAGVDQVPWLERSPPADIGSLPPHLANDPVLSHRIAQLLQRAEEVAVEALSTEGPLRRSSTRDSASSRASTVTPVRSRRGSSPEPHEPLASSEDDRVATASQAAKSGNIFTTRVNLVTV